MPLREMNREQIWLLPPTLDELVPRIIQLGSCQSSWMPWTGKTGGTGRGAGGGPTGSASLPSPRVPFDCGANHVQAKA